MDLNNRMCPSKLSEDQNNYRKRIKSDSVHCDANMFLIIISGRLHVKEYIVESKNYNSSLHVATNSFLSEYSGEKIINSICYPIRAHMNCGERTVLISSTNLIERLSILSGRPL